MEREINVGFRFFLFCFFSPLNDHLALKFEKLTKLTVFPWWLNVNITNSNRYIFLVLLLHYWHFKKSWHWHLLALVSVSSQILWGDITRCYRPLWCNAYQWKEWFKRHKFFVQTDHVSTQCYLHDNWIKSCDVYIYFENIRLVVICNKSVNML